MTEPSTQEPASLFRDAWHVYRDVVEHNYLFHRELGASVGQVVQGRFGSRPLSVLDLGCGDASQTLRALQGVRIDSYHGCDLSEAALAQARLNLQDEVERPVLECRDMLATMANAHEAFDLVFTSFAAHHLDRTDKGRFFCEARRLLEPGGLLALIDVVRDRGDDRARYLDANMDHARAHWRALNARDFQLVERTMCGRTTSTRLSTPSRGWPPRRALLRFGRLTGTPGTRRWPFPAKRHAPWA